MTADWSRRFHNPIELADGRRFETLRDCGTYIIKLKKREADEPKWQLAMRVLIEAAEGRAFMEFAKTAMLKALLPPPPPIEHTRTSSGR